MKKTLLTVTLLSALLLAGCQAADNSTKSSSADEMAYVFTDGDPVQIKRSEIENATNDEYRTKYGEVDGSLTDDGLDKAFELMEKPENVRAINDASVARRMVLSARMSDFGDYQTVHDLGRWSNENTGQIPDLGDMLDLDTELYYSVKDKKFIVNMSEDSFKDFERFANIIYNNHQVYEAHDEPLEHDVDELTELLIGEAADLLVSESLYMAGMITRSPELSVLAHTTEIRDRLIGAPIIDLEQDGKILGHFSEIEAYHTLKIKAELEDTNEKYDLSKISLDKK